MHCSNSWPYIPHYRVSKKAHETTWKELRKNNVVEEETQVFPVEILWAVNEGKITEDYCQATLWKNWYLQTVKNCLTKPFLVCLWKWWGGLHQARCVEKVENILHSWDHLDWHCNSTLPRHMSLPKRHSTMLSHTSPCWAWLHKTSLTGFVCEGTGSWKGR